MAVVHAAPEEHGRLSRLLTTDFCPWANRFVYWLKEPVGWFALATAISVMIGLYISPIGWTLAASLTAIMVAGMAWPWLAVRVTRCGLRPEFDAVYEDTPCRVLVSVANRVPIPVWGLTIEGYLDCQPDDGASPTVGLACVPPLCTADYRVNVTPTLRGHYPVTPPQVACSFPFGIWTARRELQDVKPLTVWPKVYPMLGALPISGQAHADQGEGNRGGRSGDFVGVRSFRRGDSAKHVNWVASARSDSLIVTERGGPQSPQLDVIIDTRCGGSQESLTRRIRVAASILVSLNQSRRAVRIHLGDQRFPMKLGVTGQRQVLDALADIPLGGAPCQDAASTESPATITVSGSSSGDVLVRLSDPRSGRRVGGGMRELVIGPDANLAVAMAKLWKEVRDAKVAA